MPHARVAYQPPRNPVAEAFDDALRALGVLGTLERAGKGFPPWIRALIERAAKDPGWEFAPAPLAVSGVASPAAQALFRKTGRRGLTTPSQLERTALEGSLRRLGAVHPDLPMAVRAAGGKFQLVGPEAVIGRDVGERFAYATSPAGGGALGWHRPRYREVSVVRQPTAAAEEAIGAHELTHRAGTRGEKVPLMAEAGPRQPYMTAPRWTALQGAWRDPSSVQWLNDVVRGFLGAISP